MLSFGSLIRLKTANYPSTLKESP